MMDTIEKSVGRGGINNKSDVKIIQKMLNLAIEGLQLSEDGKIGPTTIGAIDYFQDHVLRIKPDGRIDPNGSTFIKLRKKAR